MDPHTYVWEGRGSETGSAKVIGEMGDIRKWVILSHGVITIRKQKVNPLVVPH